MTGKEEKDCVEKEEIYFKKRMKRMYSKKIEKSLQNNEREANQGSEQNRDEKKKNRGNPGDVKQKERADACKAHVIVAPCVSSQKSKYSLSLA